MFVELKRTMFHSRMMAVLFGIGICGTVNLLFGFTIAEDALEAKALIRSVLTGAAVGLFLFELYKAGKIRNV